jgi:hypothetical protein
VFAVKPVINTEDPVPLNVLVPGKILTTQEPLEGRPVNKTDPVAEEQVGCVMVEIVGGLHKQEFTVYVALVRQLVELANAA